MEYTALFAIPLGYLLTDLLRSQKKIRIVFFTFIILCIVFNLKLIFSYDKCFAGSDWDFEEYCKLVVRGGYYKTTGLKWENLPSEKEFSHGILLNQKNYTGSSFRRAILRADIELYNNDPNVALVFQIEQKDTLLYWISFNFSEAGNKLAPLYRLYKIVDLPKKMDRDSKIRVFVWNKEKKIFKLKNLKLLLK